MKIRDLIPRIVKQILPLDGLLFSKYNNSTFVVNVTVSFEKKELIIQKGKTIFTLCLDQEIELDDINGSFEFTFGDEEYSLVILVPLFRQN